MKLRFTPRALENVAAIADFFKPATRQRRSAFVLRSMKACKPHVGRLQ
jgi:hypothetical protein